MSGQKKTTNNKTRLIVRILFGVLAVSSLVVMLLISPFGKRLMGKEEVSTTENVVETIAGGVETLPLVPQTNEETSPHVAEGTTNITPSVSVSVPQPTQPVENPLKNYTVFINSYKFNYTEENGITSAVAKDDEKVIMTVTPKGDVTYTDLCEKAKSELGAPISDRKLQIANANTCYSSESDHIKTTIYCIDDGNGGSIEIKYQYPSDKDGYEDEFRFMISMFKVN